MMMSTDIRSGLEPRSLTCTCIESFENSDVGIDSCVDRFTQIINDVFESISVKELIMTEMAYIYSNVLSGERR